MKKFLMCLMLVLSVVAFQPNNGILAQEEALVDDSFLELEEADTFAGKCTVPEEVAESIIPTMKLFDDTGIWVPSGPRAACETQTITIGDIRIASCNVGATVAGTGENSYGYHFQRGRNVGFPHEDDGIDAISTAAVEGPQSLVAAGEHTNFIKSGTSPYDWLTPQNNNLRWGGSDALANGRSGTNYTQRQGPCPAGFHVPSAGERNDLIKAWVSANPSAVSGTGVSQWVLRADINANNKFVNDTKMPLAGYRIGNNPFVSNRGSIGYYWSSSPNSTNSRCFDLTSSYAGADYYFTMRTNGFSLRCFQDLPYPPSGPCDGPSDWQLCTTNDNIGVCRGGVCHSIPSVACDDGYTKVGDVCVSTYQEQSFPSPMNECQYGIIHSTDGWVTRSEPTWYDGPAGIMCNGGMGVCDSYGMCEAITLEQSCPTDLACLEGTQSSYDGWVTWWECDWMFKPWYAFINEVCYNAGEANPEGCYIENGVGYQYADPATNLYARSECQVARCDAGYTQVGNECVPAYQEQSCGTNPENECQYGTQSSTDGWVTWWACTWYDKTTGIPCNGGMGVCNDHGMCEAITLEQSCYLSCLEGTQYSYDGWMTRWACTWNWNISPWHVFIDEVCYDAGYINLCYIENGVGYQYADPAVSQTSRWECRVESCNDGYTQVGNTCVPAERIEACIWLPANAWWNIVSNILQTWNGSMWLPSVTGIYSTESSTTACRFTCNDGYTRNGTSCEKAGSTGGWWGKRPDYCPDGDFSPSRYDRTCGEPPVDPEENTDNENNEHNSANDENPENSTPSEVPLKADQDTALEYLLPPPLSAGITRAEMAKLVSIYSYNHPEKKPDHTKYQCKLYTDLDTAPADLRDYVITACELGLMGYYSDGVTYKPEFSPNEIITKAEVVTVLSRMLRENKYSGTEEFRYHSHILAIYKAGIVENQDNPFMKETRGNVIMMMNKLESKL